MQVAKQTQTEEGAALHEVAADGGAMMNGSALSEPASLASLNDMESGRCVWLGACRGI